MNNSDESNNEYDDRRDVSYFNSRNTELSTREHPTTHQLRNDSQILRVIQEQPIPSQIVDTRSQSSESSLSLEVIDCAIRTKKRKATTRTESNSFSLEAKFIEVKVRQLFHQFKFLSNQDLFYESTLCNKFFEITELQKNLNNWADQIEIIEQEIRKKRNSVTQYMKEYFIRKYHDFLQPMYVYFQKVMS